MAPLCSNALLVSFIMDLLACGYGVLRAGGRTDSWKPVKTIRSHVTPGRMRRKYGLDRIYQPDGLRNDSWKFPRILESFNPFI
jgi:hypothetical protein